METKWLLIIRDLVSLAVGTFGLVHSQLTGITSPVLVAVYAALLGLPGVLNLVELKKPTKPSKEESSGSRDQPS